MKIIEAKKGEILVDDIDFDFLNQFKWHLCNGYPATDLRSKGGEVIYMYQMLLGFDKLVDHKDRNKLNNQKNNLRYANRAQNVANSNKRKNTTSRFKGVYWNTQRQKWQAEIIISGKKLFLGRFNSEILAAVSYKIKAKRIYGEFVCS